MSDLLRKTFVFLAITLALGLAAKHLLPVAMPFLLGAAIAWLAEPVVAPVAKRWKRGWAAGLGVTLTLAGVGVLLTLLFFGLLFQPFIIFFERDLVVGNHFIVYLVTILHREIIGFDKDVSVIVFEEPTVCFAETG